MKNWILWLCVGIVSLLGGLLALANPFAASLTVEVLVAWTFLFAGVLTLVSAWRGRGEQFRWGGIALGVILLIIGISLIANPLGGLISLTFLVAVALIVAGAARVVLALSPVGREVRIPLLLSGVLSVVLAAMIFFNFPASSAVALGVFLAVELISNGVALIALALAMRRLRKAL
jgi:uncharacterized membrane protein HdeD (DUF308 family)